MVGLLSTEAQWHICGEAKTGAETLLKASQLLPDIVLLDVSLPDINGLEIARRLRVQMPKIKILIVSQHDPMQLLPRALEAGADGCLDKGCLGKELLPKIKVLM
jgi:DNA-binding NarL/FixJ family response regulator